MKTFIAEFPLTYDDMLQTARLHTRLHGKKQRLTIIVFSLLLIALGAYAAVHGVDRPILMFVGIGCAVLGIYVMFYSRRTIKKNWKNYQKEPFKINYAFKSDNFEMRVKSNVASAAYTEITEIYRHKDKLFFYIGDAAVHVLPLNALYGGTAEEFCELFSKATGTQIIKY